MNFPEQYIRATEEYTTFEHFVPAPYLRRSFAVRQGGKASLLICGLGFYELYLNGSRITKGRLAPYISNPDDIVYFDRYEVELTEGENVIGVWLGNGFTNNPGGHIWDFDKARFRAAPQMALRLEYADAGEVCVLESDTQWRTAPSPITFDDYRFGEHYDARLEQPGWCAPGFDDSGWKNVVYNEEFRGELCAQALLRLTRLRADILRLLLRICGKAHRAAQHAEQQQHEHARGNDLHDRLAAAGGKRTAEPSHCRHPRSDAGSGSRRSSGRPSG